MTMFLSEQELRELTGRKRRDCQIKALQDMKLTFKIKHNGIALLREHVYVELGIKAEVKKAAPFKFNWNTVGA